MNTDLSEASATGKVKFWHEEKGYGFITGTGDHQGKEFYTFKKLLNSDHSRLWNENKVTFDIKENQGPNKDQAHACNIKIVN